LRFLIDAQLPPRLARRLAERGHDATHVAGIGLADASDADIWRAAFERAAVLVTKDQDFAVARAVAATGPAIVWVRIGNTSNDILLARLLTSLGAIEEAIARGETVVEVVPF
jgi:predicted nuclease of predicted toxin-antitoxin system